MNLIDRLRSSPSWHGNSPAEEAELELLMSRFQSPFPFSYLGFLRHFDGGVGGIGPELNRVTILSIKDLIAAQDFWEVDECMPGHILFGTNCDDFGLLFDTRQGLIGGEYPIILCPVASLSMADAAPGVRSFADLFFVTEL